MKSDIKGNFSVKLGSLIEYHNSYLHRLKCMHALMHGKSIAGQNLQFLGTSHLFHD